MDGLVVCWFVGSLISGLKTVSNLLEEVANTFFLPFFVCWFEKKSWDPTKRKEPALFLFYCAPRDEPPPSECQPK
jgi:hypothetical protein